jgi:uncharacterized RDD family membrane protein YckC
MHDYQDQLRIATPEGVPVDLVLAGLGSRFTATLIDLLFKFLLLIVILIVVGYVSDFAAGLLGIFWFLAYFGYDIAFELLANGRTPGKRWTGLRVLRDDGRPVDLVSSTIRNVVRLVDGLPLLYVPAMFFILVTDRNQRLGDLAGSTIVIREERRSESVSTVAAAPPRLGMTVNGFGLPAGVGELAPERPARTTGDILDVSAISAADLAAVRSFLERRIQLTDDVRADLARRIAGALAPRVGGATAHLQDEELIERVAAAKSRGRDG